MKFKAILDKAQITENQKQEKKYMSPPPEISSENLAPKIKKRAYKYDHVHARVDSSPPRLNISERYHNLEYWSKNLKQLWKENERLLMLIRKVQLSGGKVDCHWSFEPRRSLQYYQTRVDFLKRVHYDNLNLYKRINNTDSRVESTASLRRIWSRNRKEIVFRAENAFVLFPPTPQEIIEDAAFISPPGVKRPRVYMTIGFLGCADIGELCFELFTDVCPQTCQLFTELLDGDKIGHGYVGTCFFRYGDKGQIFCKLWFPDPVS
ncbi:unnamed protein product [Arctia plantaginis]|uniref:PPIase cyclophilin-type domain-containing protein n=1 Tax=Arctia plantaginis TaxID=874455 RepID=A0A8S0ZFR1_ARCPL|nr:unnamed protein product [Arctia plantaginis]